MGMFVSSLVSTRKGMSGFVEFIVACSWETLQLILLQLVSIAFSFDFVLAFARSGVDVLDGLDANVWFWSAMLFV